MVASVALSVLFCSVLFCSASALPAPVRSFGGGEKSPHPNRPLSTCPVPNRDTNRRPSVKVNKSGGKAGEEDRKIFMHRFGRGHRAPGSVLRVVRVTVGRLPKPMGRLVPYIFCFAPEVRSAALYRGSTSIEKANSKALAQVFFKRTPLKTCQRHEAPLRPYPATHVRA